MSDTGSKCDDCGQIVYENEDHYCGYDFEFDPYD